MYKINLYFHRENNNKEILQISYFNLDIIDILEFAVHEMHQGSTESQLMHQVSIKIKNKNKHTKQTEA